MIKYVIGHWTGGMHRPNKIDLSSYQLLIDSDGKRYNGLAPGATSSTGGMNSITYNISCCGGLSTSPITRIQIEAFYKACAETLKKFDLSVNKFYTHAEIGQMCKDGTITKLLPYNSYLYQNIGKVDLKILPDMNGTAKQTGDFIRNKILWYYQRL